MTGRIASGCLKSLDSYGDVMTNESLGLKTGNCRWLNKISSLIRGIRQ